MGTCWSREGREGRDKKSSLPRGCCPHPGLAQDPPRRRWEPLPAFRQQPNKVLDKQMGSSRSPRFCLPIHEGLRDGGLGLPDIHHQPQGDGRSTVGDAGPWGTGGSLELAEDVCVFRGDARGLQDCHAESEDAAQLQVVQSCLQRPVWHRLLWAVQEKVLWGHCREGRVLSKAEGTPPLVSASSPAPGQRAFDAWVGTGGWVPGQGGLLPNRLSAPPHLRRCCC